jgi:hypothetical protein
MILDQVFGERTAEVPLAQRYEAVQTFLFDRPDKAFRVRIAVRRTERSPDDAHTGRFEQVSNRGAPLPIPVTNEKAASAEHAITRISQLTYDLEHERLIWVRRRAHDGDTPRLQFNHEHRVVRDQTVDGPDLGCEEIRRRELTPVRSQKCLPRGRALPARWNALLLENRGDRRPCHAMTEILQRALDARVAPAWVVRITRRRISGSVLAVRGDGSDTSISAR